MLRKLILLTCLATTSTLFAGVVENFVLNHQFRVNYKIEESSNPDSEYLFNVPHKKSMWAYKNSDITSMKECSENDDQIIYNIKENADKKKRRFSLLYTVGAYVTKSSSYTTDKALNVSIVSQYSYYDGDTAKYQCEERIEYENLFVDENNREIIDETGVTILEVDLNRKVLDLED